MPSIPKDDDTCDIEEDSEGTQPAQIDKFEELQKKRRMRRHNNNESYFVNPTKYRNYNISKYKVQGEKFPTEYQFGIKMHYPQNQPGKSCLRDEINEWVEEEAFCRILSTCKARLRSAKANSHRCNANNDYYCVRFGHRMEIQHIIALYVYCNVDTVCYHLRKTYCGEPDKTNEEIERKHYDRFYWFGRFLYEAVEFFGKPDILMNDINHIKIYHGVRKRVLLKNMFGEFHQPTSS